MTDAGAPRPPAPDAPGASTASAAPTGPAAYPAPCRSPRPGGAAFLLLGLAALGVGALVWRPLLPGVWHDDGVYLMLGRALARGEGLRYLGVPGDPLAPKFPPGYPLVTAFAWWVGGDAGGAAGVAVALNLAFLAGAAALTGAWVARGLRVPLAPALAAAALCALSVDLWRPALVALSEPLYLLLMVAALWAAARAEGEGATRREAAVLAGLLVLLVYVRTAGVAVVGAALLGLALRRRLARAAGVGGAVALALVPWALWSSRAGARLPEPLRDVLGPYGRWLRAAVADDPARYLAGLPGAGALVAVRTVGLLVPAAPAPVFLVVAPVVAVAVVAGAALLARRSPTAGLALVATLAMAWLWPYQERRLLLPAFPLLGASLACLGGALLEGPGDPVPGGVTGARPGAASRRWAAGALGLLAVAGLAFAGVSGTRLARGWATAGYAIRAARLADALDAMDGRVPAGSVVGAPELWPAIPLLTGLRAVPSARFLPLPGDGAPAASARAGTPEEQFALWAGSGVDHLLLEQGGAVHGDALNALEAACPGAVRILDQRPGLILVRLLWDDACKARVLR